MESIQPKQVRISHKSCTIFENGSWLRVTWPICEVDFQLFFQIQNGLFTNRHRNFPLSSGAWSSSCDLWRFCSFLPFLFDDKPMAWEINSIVILNSMSLTCALTLSNDSANALETGHRSHSNDYTNFEGFQKLNWNIQWIYPHSMHFHQHSRMPYFIKALCISL